MSYEYESPAQKPAEEIGLGMDKTIAGLEKIENKERKKCCSKYKAAGRKKKTCNIQRGKQRGPHFKIMVREG